MTNREKELLKFLAGALCCENDRNDNKLCSEKCPYRVDGKCTDPETFTDSERRVEAIEALLKLTDTRTQYRITGRFRGSEKRHMVDQDRKWTREDAEKRLAEIQTQSDREMASKSRKVMNAGGGLGVSTPYYSEYDLLEIRLESREVTPWEEVLDNE